MLVTFNGKSARYILGHKGEVLPTVPSTSSTMVHYFTIQEELDFDQWYNDGYSPPDERYEAWIKINHPEQIRPGNDNLQ